MDEPCAAVQSFVLQYDSDENDVAKSKQRSAFPPNFIHSVDSAHMMMTAVACHEAGLTFAGGHDSFWTHAVRRRSGPSAQLTRERHAHSLARGSTLWFCTWCVVFHHHLLRHRLREGRERRLRDKGRVFFKGLTENCL